MAKSLFPSDFYNNVKKDVVVESVPLLKDYLIDMETGAVILNELGQATIVTGLDALNCRIWRIIHTLKGQFEIYSKNHGSTFIELMGYSKSVGDTYAYQKLTDALVDNVYIFSVYNVFTTLIDSAYTIDFELETLYGASKQCITIPID